MSDLVERLRCDCDSDNCTFKLAADRIEQLEAALRELFAMCLRQTDFNDDRDGLTLDRARAALEASDDK